MTELLNEVENRLKKLIEIRNDNDITYNIPIKSKSILSLTEQRVKYLKHIDPNFVPPNDLSGIEYDNKIKELLREKGIFEF
jgi:hypothetical protein